MQKRKIAVLGMILIMLITGGLFSEKGRIKGNVKDEQGKPIEKAKVKPEPQENQVSDTTEVETDAEGDFTTESLENGLYLLNVTKEGYLQKLKDITLNFTLFSNGEGFNCSNNIDIDVVLQKEESEPEVPSDMVLIPAGSFNMGSTVGGSEEQPVHAVYLDAYYIDKYEVTNGVYKEFMDAGGYSNSSYWTSDGWSWKTSNSITQPYFWNNSTFGYNATNGPSLPVVGVSWYEAYAYANWAGKRLPTEAEWEKAARGTDERTYPWGEGIDSTKLNYNGNIEHTTVVGSYESGKSPYGCYDMAGNVWEWCNDWYGDTYYGSSPTNNPQGPESGYSRVLRGGSWGFNDFLCRSAYRGRLFPDGWSIYFGFRCASGVVQ